MKKLRNRGRGREVDYRDRVPGGALRSDWGCLVPAGILDRGAIPVPPAKDLCATTGEIAVLLHPVSDE